MITIENGKSTDFKRVQKFYFNLIDEMQRSEYFPEWKKEIYPSNEYLKESLLNGSLYICLQNNNIIGSMVVNNKFNEEYEQVNWINKYSKEDISVIHILAVSAEMSNRGIGKKMVNFAINLSKKKNKKAIILDVLEGNLPAEKLYLKCGFKYIDTIPMYYEDTGWTNFKLYEYNLC